jgi:hypothetical protein
LKSLAHESTRFAELFIFNGLIPISVRAIRKRPPGTHEKPEPALPLNSEKQ